MEYCHYCKQPLAETEKVRWYDEHIHTQCYDAILAEVVAIIVTEQPTHNHSVLCHGSCPLRTSYGSGEQVDSLW
jgi:hypothetical protein